MTFDDDFIRLHLDMGVQNIPCVKIGFEFPPPERIYMSGDKGIRAWEKGDTPMYILKRVGYSSITDEQREGMTHVVRGAEYEYETSA